jgi:hypothetical protein
MHVALTVEKLDVQEKFPGESVSVIVNIDEARGAGTHEDRYKYPKWTMEWIAAKKDPFSHLMVNLHPSFSVT